MVGAALSRDDLNESIANKFKAQKDFLPFIDEIRFPRYKALKPETVIRLNWPIVAIVGPNGTNKSSVLQAIASAPLGRSLAPFWFSTSVDDIDEKAGNGGRRPDAANQHRFIYKYTFEPGEVQAECRKYRGRKAYRGQGLPKALQDRYDPDYWEPTKRVNVDGMEPIPASGYEDRITENRDRWNQIEKPVQYLDFRSELSAFDKFIHHQGFDRWMEDENQKRYRAVLRSPDVARALEGSTLSKKAQERIISPMKVLSKSATAEIAKILGKPIQSVRMVEHRLYGPTGATIKFQLSGDENGGSLEYSEAHAGSGEYAIVRLVDAFESAKPKSLILLDEPEVSLHPGAQSALMDYIKREVLKRGHQVLISTHSSTIASQLPDVAIKVLGLDPSTHRVSVIADGCSPAEAFMHLGHVMAEEATPRLIVEDTLAAEIVRVALRRHASWKLGSINIVVFSGGAGGMVKSMLASMAAAQLGNVAILLDGDQVPAGSPIRENREDILKEFEGVSSRRKAEDLWRKYFHESVPELFLDSGSTDDKFVEKLLRCVNWSIRRLGYLPKESPEELLWRIEGKEKPDSVEEWREPGSAKDWKDFWVCETRRRKNMAKQEKVTSSDIQKVQESALMSPKDPEDLLKFISDTVVSIIS